QLITDETGEIPVVVPFRDHQRIQPIAFHEGLGALVTILIFLFGERGFRGHFDLRSLMNYENADVGNLDSCFRRNDERGVSSLRSPTSGDINPQSLSAFESFQ